MISHLRREIKEFEAKFGKGVILIKDGQKVYNKELNYVS
jgi:hypothetical protein